MTLTDKIKLSLRQRYRLKAGYVLYEEVKRSAGFMKPERFADAMAISLFPSNGISITGFEIKTTRADLLAELRDLSKSEALKQFCDYWVLIIGDKDILNGKIQVPDDWGIWEFIEPSSFIIRQKPKQLYPKPVDRYFLASLLRQPNMSLEHSI